MKRLRLSTLVMTLAIIVAGSIAVASAQTANLTYTVARVDKAPTIDGALTDATWLQASQKGSKTVIDVAHDGSKLTAYPRVAYLGYDDVALYVGVVVYVPDPEKLVTSMPAASQNDEIEVFLAPNSQGYHQFIITANGTAQQNTRGVVKATNVAIDHAVSVGDIKWTLELAIPFESLGHTPSPGDEWSINLNGRQIAAGDLWVSWNPTYGSFHNAARFGTLVFGE